MVGGGARKYSSTSDVGVGAARALLDGLRPRLRQIDSADALRELLKEEVKRVLGGGSANAAGTSPWPPPW